MKNGRLSKIVTNSQLVAVSILCVACGQAEGGGGEDLIEGNVPTNADALFQFLQDGEYEEFAAESAAHASAGPHGTVRTFLDPVLEESLGNRNDSHPGGAAAVKELHDGDGVRGWAVSVKVSDISDNGDGWYWYEVFSTEENSPIVDGTGVGTCTGCHGGGLDFVLTPFPLQ